MAAGIYLLHHGLPRGCRQSVSLRLQGHLLLWPWAAPHAFPLTPHTTAQCFARSKTRCAAETPPVAEGHSCAPPQGRRNHSEPAGIAWHLALPRTRRMENRAQQLLTTSQHDPQVRHFAPLCLLVRSFAHL